jgi:hypothetical protein
LRDPLERDGRVKPITTPTHWYVRGRDQVNRRFEGYLVVEGAPEGYLGRGYFEWHAQADGGRYHFEGTFDPATRVVRWSGYCIEQRVGTPAMAHYRATLSEDGRRLENGTWSGGISVPGTWTAERAGE